MNIGWKPAEEPAATVAASEAHCEPKQNESGVEVQWCNTTVTPALRASLKQQKIRCVWLTGLSGAGKSTLANALEQALYRMGCHTILLDGDNIRHGLCNDLSMSNPDRAENIRRVAEVAKLMTDAGLIVITAFISPFQKDRDAARALFKEGDFIEVYVEASLETCEARDPKGLYKKARQGDIKNFTGMDSVYEVPTRPELVLNTTHSTPDELLHKLLQAVSFQ